MMGEGQSACNPLKESIFCILRCECPKYRHKAYECVIFFVRISLEGVVLLRQIPFDARRLTKQCPLLHGYEGGSSQKCQRYQLLCRRFYGIQ